MKFTITLLSTVITLSACNADIHTTDGDGKTDSSTVHVNIEVSDSTDTAKHTINIDPKTTDNHRNDKGGHIEAEGQNKEKVSIHIDDKGVDVKAKEGDKHEKK